MLRESRPLLAQIDPAARQLVPLLDFLGLYKPELTAFFANTVAATQASTTGASGSGVHYLRTTNPLNVENLAVHPRRLGTNRPNPYVKPGAFAKLAKGLEVFEDRHCGRAVPGIGNEALPIVGDLPDVPSVPVPQVPVPTVVPGPIPTVVPPVPTANAAAVHRAAAGAGPGRAAGSHQQVRLRQRGPGRAGAGVQEAGAVHLRGRDSQYPHVKAGAGR